MFSKFFIEIFCYNSQSINYNNLLELNLKLVQISIAVSIYRCYYLYR